MAFDYFRAEKVDYAVIEVGMGGRLDSTNIITPILSIITNISLDHTQFLGDTVEKIAFEKAGIIKKDVPALIGEIDRHSVHKFCRRSSQSRHIGLFRSGRRAAERVISDGYRRMVSGFCGIRTAIR